jgi:hypothetical protein
MRVVRFNGVWYVKKGKFVGNGLTLKEALGLYENYAE